MKKLLFILLLLFSLCSATDLHQVNVLISSDTSVPAVGDKSTNAMIGIDYIHHEVHDGNFYYLKDAPDLTGGAGTVYYQMFKTPNTDTEVHARAGFLGAEVEFLVEIYASPTVTSVGTYVTPNAANQRLSMNATLIPYANPVIANDGTRIWQDRIGSGKNGGVGSTFDIPEIIAKRNTYYLFKITKIAVTDPAWLSILFSWYEHVRKNN